MKKIIQSATGQMGAGKSRGFHQWYSHLVAENGGKPVPMTLGTPTNKLSEAHHGYFIADGYESTVISREEGFRSASEEYVRLCDAGNVGVIEVNNRVALTTKANTANRILVLDEVISPLHTIIIEFETPEEVRELAVIESDVRGRDDRGYYELVESDRTLRALLAVCDRESSKYKSHSKLAQELAAFTTNQHYRVVIDQTSLDKAASGSAFIKRNKAGKEVGRRRVFLQFTVFMLSSITEAYKDTLIISANFERTLLALMWGKEVEFRPNKFIESRLDFQDLKHKRKQVKLIHAPVDNLSKYLLQQIGNGNEEAGAQWYYDEVATCLGEMFPGIKHIFALNKPKSKKKKEYKWLLEGEDVGQRVFTNPHGWNDLQDINMAVFLAAINFDKETIRRLEDFYGITPEQAKAALAYETVAQFLGRTSIRNKDSNEEVILVLPDKGTADYICDLIDCEPSTELPIYFYERKKRGRPKVEKAENEKKEQKRLQMARYRARQKEKSAAAGLSI
ncbi:hypothetical protein [Sinorhizobium meliloti]|uniref:hypothetical protein n=1 Tax=Rhizobium meliloti TaxID=382 RepID=UPI00299DACF4|nr:hypothetical protein [Sinorhizobium meliloti]MDW9692129.1 hypothetical protein [Sinorhizobium meliloti]MDW9715823.1 hypothetical protein [Sinorhizobium meliloti]MDW9752693.1 hypothetical protein [Sinorhizobium meliloti]